MGESHVIVYTYPLGEKGTCRFGLAQSGSSNTNHKEVREGPPPPDYFLRAGSAAVGAKSVGFRPSPGSLKCEY